MLICVYVSSCIKDMAQALHLNFFSCPKLKCQCPISSCVDAYMVQPICVNGFEMRFAILELQSVCAGFMCRAVEGCLLKYT